MPPDLVQQLARPSAAGEISRRAFQGTGEAMKPGPKRRKIASKPIAQDGPPPFDLVAVKAALKEHSASKYGKPVASRMLPADLDNLNLLRAVLPEDVAPHAYRMKDGAVLKGCFRYAVQQLLTLKTGHALKFTGPELKTIEVALRLRHEASEENEDKLPPGLLTALAKVQESAAKKSAPKVTRRLRPVDLLKEDS